MNSNNRIRQNKARTKAIVAMPIAGTIVTAAILLSGLAMISFYQHSAAAQQQNVTGGNATTEGGTTTLGGPTAGQGGGAGSGTAGSGGATGSYGY